ncbi:MAG: DNA-processing protein DprA [Salinivirgaceae bacterium]|nr:DNA-processing protein DprA [Salinivirgaceae bacterium]MDD4746372.1 DNA-processing protein DprA [Salinivirgaceae bacterium]MDY0280106.1 DNA-processing protein DprA [Salinivirgaceae bacterium]
MDSTLHYLIALALTPKLGPITAKKLIAYCGGIKEVFTSQPKELSKIPGLGNTTVQRMDFDKGKKLAEEEILFCEKHSIKILSSFEKRFPPKLINCPDSPLILFVKGNEDILFKKRIFAIVGTRNSTVYGKIMVESLVHDFKERNHDITIVSGLAYGIDVIAHKASLHNQIPTAAVLGHGLDKIYPAQHRSIALNIIKENGALVTEFPHKAPYDKTNFIRRNRIIAGLSDAILVAESGISGGALATADYAQGYGRDVFAFPGKIGDENSAGCNALIKRNKAALCENLSDIEYGMNWDTNSKSPVQKQIFEELTEEEETIFDLFEDDQPITVDYLASKLAIPVYKVSSILLAIEFKGIITACPGNQYRKN